MPQQTNKVLAHLVDVDWPVKTNPCSEINLPILMQPHDVTVLRLRGVQVFDYTESLNMEPELVSRESCYRFR
jgi:hypothetical protein